MMKHLWAKKKKKKKKKKKYYPILCNVIIETIKKCNS